MESAASTEPPDYADLTSARPATRAGLAAPCRHNARIGIVDGAALFLGGRPQLACGLPQSGRAVGDDQRRRAQPAVDQVAAEREPVLVALAAAQREPEQHLAALQRDAPGNEDALGGLVVGPQLQIERIAEQVYEVVLVEPALTPAPVALARVLAHARDGRLADHRLVEGLLKRGLDVAHRQPAQERADDQRLQRVRARDMLAEDPALEPQLLSVAHARALELDRPRGRDHSARLIAVAVTHRIDRALVPSPPEELAHLVLKRLLQDQPRAQPADPLHRIGLPIDAGQHIIEFAAKPLARGYSRHAGVPPSASTRQVKAEATPALLSPGSRDGTRRTSRIR
jgi:hypothetical protein